MGKRPAGTAACFLALTASAVRPTFPSKIRGEAGGSWQNSNRHTPDEDDVSLAHVLLGVRAEEEVAATALLDDLKEARLVNYDAKKWFNV